MKKLLVPLAILLVCAFVITGCGTDNTPTTPAASTTPTATTPAATTPAATTPAATKPASTTPAATTPSTGKQTYGGTYRYITASGPGAPIGAPWLSNGTSTYCMQFSEQFLLREMADGSIKPLLASSYDVVTTAENPSVTFHLQKGVKFHDGTDFNAQAVKWNLEKNMGADSTNRGSTSNWKSIEVIDDYTIKVNLTVWQNNAVRVFADAVAYQVSPTAYDKLGSDINYQMVGTGPFVQKDFDRDVSITYTKNTNYWEPGKPFVDKVQYLIVNDAMTATALMKSGGAEVIQSYNDLMTNDLKQSGYTIIPAQVGNAITIWPDSKNADSPWSNLKVRMAAEYAIDKVGISKTFGYGNWTPSYQYYPESSAAFDKSLTARTYDIAKGKALMAEAGYPNGFKTTIYVSPFDNYGNVAVAIQASWNSIGIKAELQYPQTGAFAGMLTGTWKNGVLFGPGPSSANPNAGWSAISPTSAWYGSLKRPEGWTELYNASLQAKAVDPALAQKAEAALYNDVTNIPVFFTFLNWAVTPAVHDAGLGTRGIFAWMEPQDMWLGK